MRIFIASLAVLICALCGAVSGAQDISAYFLTEDKAFVKISPSGDYIAYYQADAPQGLFTDGTLTVERANDQSRVSEIRIYNHEIDWLDWADDDRLALYARAVFREKKGRTSRDVVRDVIELYDLKSGAVHRVYDKVANPEKPQAAAITVIGHDTVKGALMLTFKDKNANSAAMSLMRLDPARQSLDTVIKGTAQTLTWGLEPNGAPRLRVDQGEASYISRYFRREGLLKSWRHFYTSNNLTANYSVIAIGQDADTAMTIFRGDSDQTIGLYQQSLTGLNAPVLAYAHPQYDLAGAKFIGAKQELYYAFWWDDRLERHWFDPRREAIGVALEALLPEGTNWQIDDVIGEDKIWIVRHNSANSAPEISRFDVASLRLTTLVKTHRALDPREIPQKRRVDFTARDGLKLRGYFTKGLRPSRFGHYEGPAQLLVMPHRGPGFRDVLDWDPWVQYFASAGYDVFQPQFRGSGQMGRDFETLGDRQWGRAMQADIADGIAAIEASGLIGKGARRAALGRDFGGYAALMEGLRAPGDYACLASINGVFDLPRFLEDFDRATPEGGFFYHVWELRLGPSKYAREPQIEVSPARHAGDLKSEIYLVHGRDNDLFAVSQSELMHQAARAAGVKSTLVRFDGTGHDDWSRDQEYDILSAVDGFLERCMR